jgi:pimeloyl-ACP methyl ester carboxylesterase
VPSERRFDTGTVELNYGEGPPNGPPFVILHGGAGSWRYADALIALLADRWHVYAPDLRGHGLSGRVPGRYDLRDYAADIAAFLAGAVREPAVVYGHSLGAEVAIMAAAAQPGLFRAVVHGDVQFSRDDDPAPADRDNLQYRLHMAQNELWHRLAGRPVPEIAAALRAMPVFVPGTEEPVRAGDAFGDENPWFEFQATNLHRLDPDMLAAVREGRDAMRAGYDPETLLPAISCPVLILQADPAAGGALSDEEVALGLRLLPRATHVRLGGMGHELHGRHAQRVLDAMGPFLATV